MAKFSDAFLLDDILSNTKVVNGCWVWKGAKTRGGYGHKAIGHNPKYKYYRVHRLVYHLIFGKTDDIIMHKCDNPPCCNPYHLKSGTTLDNIRDKIQKGRNSFGVTSGSNCHLSKINETDVVYIRENFNGLESAKLMSKKFNLHYRTIERIAKCKSWKHVK